MFEKKHTETILCHSTQQLSLELERGGQGRGELKMVLRDPIMGQ